MWDRDVEPRPNPDKVARSLAELARVLPAAAGAGVAESWAGYIDATPDLVPVLGEAPVKGLVVATGFSGHGFAMGPVAGRLVSELILDGKSSLDIAPFRFSRFAEGALARPKNVLCQSKGASTAPFEHPPGNRVARAKPALEAEHRPVSDPSRWSQLPRQASRPDYS